MSLENQQKQFGRYLLLQQIGKGSSGEVYKASARSKTGLVKHVAIKVLFPSFGMHSEQKKMDFINEARLGALLRHPNIVEVLDLGSQEDKLYIAMEFVDGYSLRHLLDQQHSLPLNIALRITKDVAHGLKYASTLEYQGREIQLVHRDIKPANILVTKQGLSKIGDFGLARALGISELTEGGIHGTLNYMSPEQARGDRLDFRSDIFSLGLILYEMLCGERIFDHKHHFSLILKVQEIETIWHSKLRSNIHEKAPQLEEILQKMLSKNPSSRYDSYDELILDIEKILLLQGIYHNPVQTELEPIPEDSIHVQLNEESSVSVVLPKNNLFGRDIELQQLETMIKEHALIQIKGEIGVGKSALAYKLWERQQFSFERAIFLVVEKIQTRKDFCDLLFRHLGITAPNSDGVEELLDFFRVSQNVLLILDGEEPFSDNVIALLTYWQKSYSDIRIVICSPLLILPNIEHIDLMPLSTKDVLAFFKQENPEISTAKIQQLLPYVEGIPLLMVLISSQLKSTPIATYLDLIKKQGVEQSWQVRMNLTWEQLKPWERTSLCQLSVFEGFFSMYAAEKVIDLTEFNMTQLYIDVLGSLLSYSLLQSENREGEVYFCLSRRLNNFVRKHCSKNSYQQACHRHAQFYAYSSQIFLDKGKLFLFYHYQEANFSRAIRKSFQYGWTDLAIRCVLTWQSCVGKLNVPYSLFPLVQQLAEHPDVSPIGKAELQYISGQQLRLQGKYLESVHVLLSAKRIFEHYKRYDRIADVQSSLCISYTELARYKECNEEMNAALVYARKGSDVKREAIFLKDYGYSLSQQGRLEEAQGVLEKSVQQLMQIGEPIHAFGVCSNLGLVHLRRNNIDQASYFFRRAIQVSKLGRIDQKIDIIWMNLGICAVLQGDIPRAEKAFFKASKQMKKIGALRSLAILYANWAKLRMLQMDLENADHFADKSETLCRHHPHPITEHTLALVRVSLSLLRGEPQKAKLPWHKAMSIVEENQYTFKKVETGCLGVELFSQLGQFEKAQDLFFEIKDTTSHDRIDAFWLCYAQAQFSKYKKNPSMFNQAFTRAKEIIEEHCPHRADILFYFAQLRYT